MLAVTKLQGCAVGEGNLSRMIRVLARAGALATLLAGAYACSPSFEGEYSDPGKAEIVDDRWNETDARKTAEHMIQGMLEKPWLDGFKKAHGGQKPIVFVMDVENRTDEHLDVKQLTDYIQDELINSGKVRFVNKDQRQKILDELKYQNSGAVNKSTAKLRRQGDRRRLHPERQHHQQRPPDGRAQDRHLPDQPDAHQHRDPRARVEHQVRGQKDLQAERRRLVSRVGRRYALPLMSACLLGALASAGCASYTDENPRNPLPLQSRTSTAKRWKSSTSRRSRRRVGTALLYRMEKGDDPRPDGRAGRIAQAPGRGRQDRRRALHHQHQQDGGVLHLQ